MDSSHKTQSDIKQLDFDKEYKTFQDAKMFIQRINDLACEIGISAASYIMAIEILHNNTNRGK